MSVSIAFLFLTTWATSRIVHPEREGRVGWQTASLSVSEGRLGWQTASLSVSEGRIGAAVHEVRPRGASLYANARSRLGNATSRALSATSACASCPFAKP